jgi:hypothetical protein
LKAKTGSNKGVEVRWSPIDEETYPVQLIDGQYFYWRFYCGKFFIVYEKYKNNVKLGYLVLPQEKELFQFQSMINYVEGVKSGEIVCVSKLSK